MIFIAKPDYAEYEMISEITLMANYEKEAIDIAEMEAAVVNE